MLCEILFAIWIQLGGLGKLEGVSTNEKNGTGNVMEICVGR